eukprot:scaffold2753_cov238-Chaetoceros_neogracile.AAC.11
MTIKIEREALQCITNDEVCCLSDEQQVDRTPGPRSKLDDPSCPELELTDDDSSVSSYSFSCSTTDKRVTWSNPLVMEVRTRERTKPEDVKLLFYSYEETQRFRQEYRIERRRAAEIAASENESKFNINKSASLPACGWSSRKSDDSCVTTLSSVAGSHRISRVVIKHKNTQETFFDQELSIPSDDTSLVTSINADIISNTAPDTKMGNGDFFDNDSFWSGQITWY